MTTQTARVPPHNLEAEESVLGSCLLSAKVLADVFPSLPAEDFYKPVHRDIWTTMFDLMARGESVDATTVADALARRGKLDEAGGRPYLFTLIHAVPSPGSAPHYAKIVREMASLRRLIEAAQEIGDRAYALPEDVEAAANEAEQLIFQAAARRTEQGLIHMEQVVIATLDALEPGQTGAPITGAPSGVRSLDVLTRGFQPEDLIILGGRPGMGKSILGMQTAVEAACSDGHGLGKPVAYFSLEMPKEELGARMMAFQGRIDHSSLERGLLTVDENLRLSDALGQLAVLPLWVDDKAETTVSEIASKCRRLVVQQGALGLIVVDYLQLLVRNQTNAVQELSGISRGLKLLARELHCPVLALSQLSRDLERRMDKRPQLADLRSSGSLEQDADLVMFVYRDEEYNPDSADKGLAEVCLAKHRGGAKGTVKVDFAGAYMRFG